MYRFNATTLSRPQKTRDGRQFLNAEFVSPHRGHVWEDKSRQLWYAGSNLYRLHEKDGKVEFESQTLVWR